MTILFLDRAKEVAKRTALHGLNQSSENASDRAKWFFVWCGDVAGELGEFLKFSHAALCEGEALSEKALCEAGDVVWGISAIALLLDIPADQLTPVEYYGDSSFEVILGALELLEHGKKVCRDCPRRDIDLDLVIRQLRQVYAYLLEALDLRELNLALELVDTKLKERYPNGYSPAASVNRVV